MDYFITETYLKETTAVGPSVDANFISPAIRVAADTYVRSIIGTYFYNYLLTQYNAQTLNPDETNLVLNWIKPAVAWRACSEVTINTSYQLTNKGLQTNSGDYSSSPEYKVVMWKHHHSADKATFYENRLLDYLADKTTGNLFPQFMDDQNKEALARKKCKNANVFNQSIYLI